MTLNPSTDDPRWLLAPVRRLHELIRAAVVDACERSAVESLAEVEREEEGDTIYAVDRVSEELIVEFFEREVAHAAPVVLVAEGLPHGGQVVLPHGALEADAVWRVIVDPIDGTRGLMYQKRSGWILTGVAPNRGAETSLADIELAVQTEIPLVKQHLSDAAWAVKGEGAHAERFNRLTGESEPSNSDLRNRPPSRTATRRCRASSPARARSWRRLTRRSCWARSGRCSRARRTASRTSTRRAAGSSTS